MTAATSALHFEIDPIGRRRRQRHRPQWRRGLRAVRALLQDAERTELALEIGVALDGDTTELDLAQMLAHKEGRRIYREGPALLEALGDRDSLERLPADSFGRAYLAHIDRFGLEPRKLIELGERAGSTVASADPETRWLSQRGLLTHDLWHVLTGYGADQLGEGALLSFTLAQTGRRLFFLLTIGFSLRMLLLRGISWLPYVWKSWRRGRAALCLQAVPYEELLALPLAEVRAALHIEAPEVAHPGGVLCGDPIGAAD